MSNPPIVNNYYLPDESSIPIPLFITPNVSVESLSLSQPKSAPRVREKREREPTQHECRVDGIAVRTSALSTCGRGSVGGKQIVNPYEKRHQGPLQPLCYEEETACISRPTDGYRRVKLPRKEPLVLAGENYDIEKNSAALRADIRRMQDQYDYLSKLVEETRAELQRSREASEHSKESTFQSLADFRVEIAQLTKHVELLEGRHSSLEKTATSLKGLQTVVDSFRGDIASLRSEVNQKSAAILVLEKLMEEMKRQSSVSLPKTDVPSFSLFSAAANNNNNTTTATATTASTTTSATLTSANNNNNTVAPFIAAAGADENKLLAKNPFSFSGTLAGSAGVSTSGFGVAMTSSEPAQSIGAAKATHTTSAATNDHNQPQQAQNATTATSAGADGNSSPTVPAFRAQPANYMNGPTPAFSFGAAAAPPTDRNPFQASVAFSSPTNADAAKTPAPFGTKMTVTGEEKSFNAPRPNEPFAPMFPPAVAPGAGDNTATNVPGGLSFAQPVAMDVPFVPHPETTKVLGTNNRKKAQRRY